MLLNFVNLTTKSVKLDPVKHSFMAVTDQESDKKVDFKLLRARDTVGGCTNTSLLQLQLYPPLSRRKHFSNR